MLNLLNDCDKEPIHIPNAIQPHGALVGADKDGKIICCSENIGDYSIFKNSKALLETSVTSFLNSCRASGNVEISEFSSKDFNFYELTPKVQNSKADVEYLEIERLLNSASTLNSVFFESLKYIQKVTKYDRILLYQFKDDESGHVILEVNNGTLGLFLGHHFPANDIPKQARALYILNRVRQIPDINYKSVGLVRRNSISASELDLSMSKLRSVSPVHIEYMKNMDVGCSFSVSIVKEDRLWGLIACHSLKPTIISNQVLGDLERLSFLLSEQISKLHDQSIANRIDKISKSWTGMTFDWKALTDNYLRPEKLNQIMSEFECQGISIRYLDQNFSFGNTLSQTNQTNILQHMKVELHADNLNTSKLLDLYPSMHTETVRGVAIKKLSSALSGEVILYRNPVNRTRVWAGQPSFDKDNYQGRIHPRKSFEKFSEEIVDRSQDWGQAELRALDLFCHDLDSHISDVAFRTELPKNVPPRALMEFLIDPRMPWMLIKVDETSAKLEWMNAACELIFQNSGMDFFIDSFQSKANVNLRSLLKQGRRFIDVSGDFVNLNSKRFTLRLIARNIDSADKSHTFLISIQDRSTEEILGNRVIGLSEQNQILFESFKISNFELDLESNLVKVSPNLKRLMHLKNHQMPSWSELCEFLSNNEAKFDLASIINKTIAYNQDKLELELNLKSENSNTWLLLNAFIEYSIFPRKALRINAFLMDITNQKMASFRTTQMSKLAAVGEMASNIAHELKNPLGILNLTAERLDRKLQKENLDAKELQGISAEFRVELDRIMNLISNMGQFSRIDQSENLENFDLIILLKDIISLFANLKKKEQIRLVLNSEMPELKITSSATKIQQILFNLLNNASDALKGVKEPEIRLNVRSLPNSFQIIVSDNGGGIPESVKDQIFDSFFTTKPKGKGTGLGLSISKETALSLGGDLVLDWQKNAGAKFVLSFPLK